MPSSILISHIIGYDGVVEYVLSQWIKEIRVSFEVVEVIPFADDYTHEQEVDALPFFAVMFHFLTATGIDGPTTIYMQFYPVLRELVFKHFHGAFRELLHSL